MRFVILLLLLITSSIANYGQKFVRDSFLSKNYCLNFAEKYPYSTESILAQWCLVGIYSRNNDRYKVKITCQELVTNTFAQKGTVPKKYHMLYQYASDTLSKIAQAEKKYDSALYYLFLMDTVYQYNDGCANGYMAHKISIACRFATIYQKQGKPDLAEQALLSVAFISEMDIQIKKLKTIYQMLDKEKLKAELSKSIENYKTISVPNGHYYFTFRSTKVQFGIRKEDRLLSQAELRAKILAKLKSSELYKMVMAL